jgi:hypothetical protein
VTVVSAGLRLSGSVWMPRHSEMPLLEVLNAVHAEGTLEALNGKYVPIGTFCSVCSGVRAYLVP